MTKAVICVQCADIFAPYRDPARGWRWCDCGTVAGRWSGMVLAGQLEITSRKGADMVRVLGLANPFLLAAVQGRPYGDPDAVHEEWRLLHDRACEDVPPNYLFHESKRHCWAVVIRPGETGDVRFVDYEEAATGSS